MRLFYRCLHFGSLAMCALSNAIVVTIDAIDRFVAYALALWPAEPALATEGTPRLSRSIGGIALARSTQQGLRHEAGVPRRAAPRNI